MAWQVLSQFPISSPFFICSMSSHSCGVTKLCMRSCLSLDSQVWPSCHTSHAQDSFSLLGGCIAYVYRPTLGWTVGEYILHWQSKLASSTVQPWVGRWRITSFLIWECAGSAEEAFISLFANWLPLYTCLDIIIDERIWRAILELVAVVTRVVNIMNGEVLEAAVEELDGLAHMCLLCRCKTVSRGLQKHELSYAVQGCLHTNHVDGKTSGNSQTLR